VTRSSGGIQVLLPLLAFRLVVGCVVVVYSPSSILSTHPGHALLPVDLPTILGALVTAVGLGFYFRSAWDFAFTAGGLEPTNLLARGTYRVVRNPMYLGLVLVLFGESVVFGSWALACYGAAVWLCVHLIVVLYEERALLRRSGASYAHYCHAVPRWVPGFRAFGTQAA
jgi:protein-S-isoprenylcysteine O-methyltransferase Ste14